MAKVRNPLHSLRASGPVGEVVRYARTRGIDRARQRQTPKSAGQLKQRRQATIISEGARMWNTRAGRGPETTYKDYVRGLSQNNWYFMTGAILLEWNADTLMTAD